MTLKNRFIQVQNAEMVFTNSSTRESAAEYRRTLDAALTDAGRTPGTVPAIPGLIPYLGKTAAEAEEKLRELDGYVDWAPIAPFALGQFGIDIPLADIEAPFPTEALPVPADVEATIKSTFGNYVGLYNWIQQRPGVTVREGWRVVTARLVRSRVARAARQGGGWSAVVDYRLRAVWEG